MARLSANNNGNDNVYVLISDNHILTMANQFIKSQEILLKNSCESSLMAVIFSLSIFSKDL